MTRHPAGRLLADLEDDIAPAIEQGILALRQAHAGHDRQERARLERLAAGWEEFKRIWRSGALSPTSPAARQATADRLAAAMASATGMAAELAVDEAEEAHASQQHAEATYRAARSRILLLSAGSFLVWLVIALALVRDLVPRLQAYSRFAARVADGHLGERLAPTGGDEVAELGRTLDQMVERHERRRDHEASQAEFADTMQLSETEVEAHDLLRRHLERSIKGSRVTVLNRNNSADRLEAATPVEPDCPLTVSLQGPSPARAWPSASGASTRAAPTASRCSPAGSAPTSRATRSASRCWSAARSSGRCWSTTPGRPKTWGRGSRSRSARPPPSWPTCATWPSPRSGRPPTPSPGCPTTGRCRTPSSGWSPRRRGPWPRCRRRCWTWTTSSTSTTPTGTAAATRSWPPWPRPCAPRCARATSSAATAARSS